MNSREFKEGDVVYLKGNRITCMVISAVFNLSASSGVLSGKEHAKCYWLDNHNVLQCSDIPVSVLFHKEY